MRLLIYTHFFAPSIGGVETYARLLAEGLAKRAQSNGTGNIEVTVATATPADPELDVQFPFSVVRQPGWFDLLKLIRSATVVQLAGPSLLPMFLAFFLRRPYFIEQHAYQAACPNGLLLYEPSKTVCPGHFLARRFGQCLRCNRESLGWRKSLNMLLLTFPRRWLCRHASTNIAVTSHVSQRLGLAKTHVVYHGVPDPLLHNEAHVSSASGEGSVPLCFAYVGRLVSEKGLPLLLQAAQQLRQERPNFRVKFVGDGRERCSLEAMVTARQLQQQVTFTGFLRGKQLEEALRDVAAIVMPSIWEETAGLAAIEQMFRGRLVIASDIGGLGEVVGTTGLKFPAGDVQALVSCMKQVLDNPDIVSAFGQRARSRALDCFGLERMLDEHAGVYAGLSDRPAPGCGLHSEPTKTKEN